MPAGQEQLNLPVELFEEHELEQPPLFVKHGLLTLNKWLTIK
jgi:hypothetical protein